MTDAPPPLTSEEVDELLSAELDDDFDAAARDLGLEPDRARVALHATPGTEARRRALAAARDALARSEDLDEVTAARLRTTALAEFPEATPVFAPDRASRGSRFLVVAGSLAAGLALVVGLAIAVHGAGTGGNASKSSAAARLLPTSVPNESAGSHSNASENFDVAKGAGDRPANLGTFASVDALAARMSPTLSATARAADSTSNAVKTPAAGSNTTLGTTCTATLNTLDARNAPRAAGAAVVANKPVTVYVFTNGSGQQVAALDSGCRLVGTAPIASP